MYDTTNGSLQVQALEDVEAAEAEAWAPDLNPRLQGQFRRSGSMREVPAPQRYRDYPAWLVAPNKNPALARLYT